MKKSIGARTIAYPTPVFIVGTFDKDDRPNVMAAAWGGICCSRPPCVAVSLRAATYTHGNILAHGCFTVSIPSTRHVAEADYYGLVSGRNRDKFEDTGLTPAASDVVHAPYVDEFPFVLECSLRETVEIGSHTQFIGEIRDIKVEESLLMSDGRVHIEDVKPFLYAPDNRAYYGVGELLGPAFSIGRSIAKE